MTKQQRAHNTHDAQGELRDHLIALMRGGQAHVDFDEAVADLPSTLRGRKPAHLPHTPWRLVEHMRRAQQDILEFSRNRQWESPPWPDGYWPDTDAPPTADAWEQSIEAFHRDREAMIALVGDAATDLFVPIPWGNGETVLREAMLVADHNSYHIGQLVTVRRLLNAWP